MPEYLSVSQRNTYTRCPYSYKLKYLDKVWQKPASWLSQGLGVHKAMEEWEKSGRTITRDEAVKIYEDEFTRSINEQLEATPDFVDWFGSGPYSSTQDVLRRWDVGREQLLKLMDWSESQTNSNIWNTPQGLIAVELELDVDINGHRVRGYIDQVVETPQGLIVRDIKTGAKPGDAFQLAVYAVGIEKLHGESARFGDYLMGKTGKPTKPVEITQALKDEVAREFDDLQENLDNENFPSASDPKVCRMCSVRASCEFAAG